MGANRAMKSKSAPKAPASTKSKAAPKQSALTKSSTKQPIKSRTKPPVKNLENTKPITAGAQEKSISSMQHHEVNEMVSNAIASLQEKKGSSLKSITNFIVKTYKVDAGKQGVHIRKYLKTATINDKIIKVKSNRASGKFMLPEETVQVKGKKPAPKKASKQVKKSEKMEVDSKKSEQTKKQSAVKRPAPEVRQQVAASKKQKTGGNQKSKNSKKQKEVPRPATKPAAATKSRKAGKGKHK